MNHAAQNDIAYRATAAFALVAALAGATMAGWLSLDHSLSTRAEVTVAIWVNIVLMLVAMGVEASRRPYSLHLMHLLALFLFLGVPALYQYTVGRFYVAGPIDGMRGHLLPAVLAVMLWLVAYIISYEVSRQVLRGSRGPVLRLLDRPLLPSRTVVVLILAVVALVYLGALGLAGAATRFSARDAIDEATFSTMRSSGLVVHLIHYLLLRALSIVALLAGIVLVVREPRSRSPFFLALLALVGVGTLIANNPFAASRMWFATTSIGFAAPLLLRRLRTGWGLVLIAVAGLTLLPSLGQSRDLERFDEILEIFAVVSPVRYLSQSGDVDSLGMLALCHVWTSLNEYRYGLQEVGAVLFWVPRVLWSSKPVETGTMVTHDLGFQFTNLAPPIMSETLVDFGFIGIPFVAAFLGFVFSRLDRGYWEGGPGLRVVDAIYPLWIGCVIFITRGGLSSSLSFTAAFSAWLFVFAVGVRRSGRLGHRQGEATQLTS